MSITRTFVAANGRSVVEVRTDSGATGYVDAEVTALPSEAIEAWLRRLTIAQLRNVIERRALSLRAGPQA